MNGSLFLFKNTPDTQGGKLKNKIKNAKSAHKNRKCTNIVASAHPTQLYLKISILHIGKYIQLSRNRLTMSVPEGSKKRI